MTLALSRQHEITLEAFSELKTTLVALELDGVPPEEQPVAKILGATSLHEATASDILRPPADDEEDRLKAVEAMVYEGDDGAVCLGAIRKLARSRDSYYQRNAVLMLKERGMGLTAYASQAISTMRSRFGREVVKIEPAESLLGEVVLNHDIDYLPPLTDAEVERMEDLIAKEEARPVTPPEYRSAELADTPTGAVMAIPGPRSETGVFQAA